MSLYKLEQNPAYPISRVNGVDGQIVQANTTAEAKALAGAYSNDDGKSAWEITPTDLLSLPTLTGWAFNVKVRTDSATDALASLAVNAAGTNYAVGDEITLAGGTHTQAAVVRVTAVDAPNRTALQAKAGFVRTGPITAVSIKTPGVYSVDPTDFTQGSTTSAAGTGATFDTTTFSDILTNLTPAINVTVTGDSDDLLDDIGAKLVTALNATVIDHSAYNTGSNVLTVSSIADGLGDKVLTVTVTPPAGTFPASYTWDQTDLVTAKVDAGIAGAVLTVTFSTTWLIPTRIRAYAQK